MSDYYRASPTKEEIIYDLRNGLEKERAARAAAEAERDQAREQLTDLLPERDALCSIATQTSRELAAAREKLEQAKELLHVMWGEADSWAGPQASSHFRSEIAERIRALEEE